MVINYNYIRTIWNGLTLGHSIAKKSFCTSTYKLYINENNESSNFVGNSKMKPVDYNGLFLLKKINSEILAQSEGP